MVKVYNDEGKCVDRFRKNQSDRYTLGHPVPWDAKVRLINQAGYYIKGQITKKGIKIK